ncbi:MAG: hypothetical protein ACHBNF_15960 [Chromatiales bacterium]
MRYLSEDQVTQMMGVGYLGEVRQGPDGNLYQYVQGVDGLGNPIGSWWKRLARRALPFVQKIAPFIPGASAALTAATPFLQQAGVAGPYGLGELYQAPDGTLYQMQGLAQDQELRGLGEGYLMPMMGVGYLGEVRQGLDGNLYQYVQGVDGLGNPIGAWWKRLARRALPFVQKIAPFIPGASAALTAATPLLKQAGVEGYEGLDDDAELRGIDADDELRGIDDDPELRGVDEGEELRGFDDDMELRGLEDDAELRGLDDSEDLRGFEADQEMQGMEGYVRQDGVNGLEAYVPQEPPQTRWHVRPAQAPEMWKPLW